MEETALINGALMLSALTYVGYQMKAIPKILWQFIERKILFTTTIEETDELYFYMERFMKEHYDSQYRNVQATISDKDAPHKSKNEYIADTASNSEGRTIPKDNLYIWQHEDYFIIRYGKRNRRLVIKKGREKLEAAKDLWNAYFNRFIISGFFAKSAIIELLEDVVEYNQQFKKQHPPQKWISYSHGEWYRFGYLNTKPLDAIILDDKDLLVEDVKNFLHSREWYQTRSIPYKRGYIFYGEPGNGKTTTCLGLAAELDKDIYFLTLNDLNNDNALRNAFQQLGDNAILVLEDIDCIYNDRKKNDDVNSSISFSTLLNCLDGAFSKENMIVIMTTNHKEKLDPALIRSGRVDMHLEINNPTRKSAQEYIQLFFEDDSLVLEKYQDGCMPMVDVQDICLRNKDNVNKALGELENNKWTL